MRYKGPGFTRFTGLWTCRASFLDQTNQLGARSLDQDHWNFRAWCWFSPVRIPACIGVSALRFFTFKDFAGHVAFRSILPPKLELLAVAHEIASSHWGSPTEGGPEAPKEAPRDTFLECSPSLALAFRARQMS